MLTKLNNETKKLLISNVNSIINKIIFKLISKLVIKILNTNILHSKLVSISLLKTNLKHK